MLERKSKGGLLLPMGKLNKGKLIIPLVLSVVIGASGCSSDPKTSSIDQTKIARHKRKMKY